MTLRCGESPRCMARLVPWQQQCRRLPGSPASNGWKPTLARFPQTATVGFSVSKVIESNKQSAAWRRRSYVRSQRPKYPKFRQESPEHRLVRENHLFDPIESRGNDDEKRRALKESKHVGSLPLRLATTSELEREMIWSATRAERGIGKALRILTILLRERAQEKKTLHYETLIALNASANKGSAASIRSLLQEMAQQNIACDVNTYTSILRSLVVHPDIDILNQVLDGVASSWIELDAEMLHYTTAIYIRLDMPEIALEYLDRIEGLSTTASFATRADQSKIQSGQAELWLYVLLINRLATRRDWEGVLRICHRLGDDTSLGPFSMRQLDIPYAFWERLLYISAKYHDPWLTSWIWNTWVVRDWFRPSIRVCATALKTFMRHELKNQAFSAIKILRTFGAVSGERAVSTRGRSGSSATRRKASIRNLTEYLDLAEEQLGVTKPNEAQAGIGAHWLAFQHDSHSKVFAPAGLRINPWGVLPKKGADPGELWARIANERYEERMVAKQQRELHDHLRQEQTTARAKVNEKMSALPEEAPTDASKLADVDFDLRYRKLRLKRLQADTASQAPAGDDEESSNFDDDEIDYIDYEPENSINNGPEDSFEILLRHNPFSRVHEPTPLAKSSDNPEESTDTDGPSEFVMK